MSLMEMCKSGSSSRKHLPETMHQLAWVCFVPGRRVSAAMFASQPVRGEGVKRPDTEASIQPLDSYNNFIMLL